MSVRNCQNLAIIGHPRSAYSTNVTENCDGTQRPYDILPSCTPPHQHQKAPWVYGFALDPVFLTHTYGGKFIPIPPDSTEQDIRTLTLKRTNYATVNLTKECKKVWPDVIGVVPGFSTLSKRTVVLALFACSRPNRGYIPTEEERVQLDALKEILVREGFSFPKEELGWFVAT